MCRPVLYLLLVTITLLGSLNSAQAQNKNGKKKGENRAAAAKGRLPQHTADLNVRRDIAPVEPARKADAIKSAARIDLLIEKGLVAKNLQPNSMTDDAQFVRRAYLDIAGTIPTAEQAESFIRRSGEDKRAGTIDLLLNSPGYVSNSYNYWADILRIVDREGNNNELQLFGEWVKNSISDNMPYDEFVNEMVAAEGTVLANPAAGYHIRDLNMPLDNLNNTVRIFLGTRIGCAQCHNHPFDRWTQKEFYELAAYMGGQEYRGNNNRKELNQLASRDKPKDATDWLYDKIEYNSREANQIRNMMNNNRRVLSENAKKNLTLPHDYAYDDAKPKSVVQPATLFGDSPLPKKGESRREILANWMTSPDNPRFTTTIVNRLWKRVMGVGLIEPVDDMMDSTVASNPELLDYLVSEMKRLDYNQKEFLRILYYTKTYQRQACFDDLAPTEDYYFPGPILRRMSAEQAWDSLLTLTIPNPDAYVRPSYQPMFEIFDLSEVDSSQDLLDKYAALEAWRKEIRKGEDSSKYKGILLARASELPSPLPQNHFLRQFGQSDREEISASHTEGTVPQLLTMFNGMATHMMLEAGSVIHSEVTKVRIPEKQVDRIFLSILGRHPSEEERKIALKEISESGATGHGNVIWSLLNTREFLFIQ